MSASEHAKAPHAILPRSGLRKGEHSSRRTRGFRREWQEAWDIAVRRVGGNVRMSWCVFFSHPSFVRRVAGGMIPAVVLTCCEFCTVVGSDQETVHLRRKTSRYRPYIGGGSGRLAVPLVGVSVRYC
ncbi:hypothetical protein K466DRAFT_213814 [Polyporus arcularius HHB13444]|uniref:Uncharacterized protein n=1 Tax=Polyporus arcularius HHB13444 TaxID=1314778 RepID=A0A5C3P544_9APHY|nr:hypothetical protein K466DRAFT_213814 [Polyporus arcularius HHB13444]